MTEDLERRLSDVVRCGNPPTVEPVWELKLPSEIGNLGKRLVIRDNTAVVLHRQDAEANGRLFVIDTALGQVVRRFDTHKNLRIVDTDTQVYVVDFEYDGPPHDFTKITCSEPKTGRVLWERTDEGESRLAEATTLIPALRPFGPRSVICNLLQGGQTTAYLLDFDSGNVSWERNVEPNHGYVVNGDLVFSLGPADSIEAIGIDPSICFKVTEDSSQPSSVRQIFLEDGILVAQSISKLRAYNFSSGEELWSRSLPGPVLDVGNGLIFCYDIEIRRLKDGKRIKRFGYEGGRAASGDPCFVCERENDLISIHLVNPSSLVSKRILCINDSLNFSPFIDKRTPDVFYLINGNGWFRKYAIPFEHHLRDIGYK